MTNTTFALVCLSLFTDLDRAAEIEGDLLEQSRRHGRLWFWLQLKLTCIALFFHSLRAEPGKLLLFSYAVYELVQKLNWWVLNPLRFSLWRELDLDVSQLPVMDNLFNALVAFSFGMLLTRLSPKHGGQIAFLAAGLMLGRVALLDGLGDFVRLCAFGLVPATAGVLLMKWLELRSNGSQGLWTSP